MQRSLCSLAWVLLLAGLAATGHAAERHVDVRETARTAVEKFRREQPQATVQVNPATGLVRSLSHLRDVRPPTGVSVESAAAFVDEHHAMLLGDRALEELQLSRVQQLPTSSHVHYQQVYQGLPVWSAGVSVHLDAQGGVRMLHASVRPQIAIDTTPVLTPADALRIARGAIGAAGSPRQSQVTLGVLPLADRARLAYRVEIATPQPADWHLFIDACSGAVLKQTNHVCNLDGEGLVVDENLLTTPETVMRPFRDLYVTGYLTGSFANVLTFDRIDDEATIYGTRLSWVIDRRFKAPTTDPRFDEQMVYYHVNQVHDYFHSTLGFTDRDQAIMAFVHMPKIDAKTNRVKGPLDNAYYSPAYDSLFFGDGTGISRGGLNATSRDSDVIYHEYTHSVAWKIVRLVGEERDSIGDALSEAYADYFACTINNDPEVGEYAQGLAEGLRSLKNNHRYPEDVNLPETGEPEAHWTGQIWSGACWDVRTALGVSVADRVIFQSLYYVPGDGDATWESAVQAVLQADQELYNGAHDAAIRRVMTRRGIPTPAPQAATAPVLSGGRGSGVL